jgi:hypothetical protein
MVEIANFLVKELGAKREREEIDMDDLVRAAMAPGILGKITDASQRGIELW